MSVLSRADINRLLEAQQPLVEGWLDLAEQVQPNGFDISVRDIASLDSRGTIAATNSGRSVSKAGTLLFDENGFIDLAPGVYLITYNEVVHLPTNVMALARPRSSLVRCGVDVGTAVWDAGYSGRSNRGLWRAPAPGPV